METHRLSRRRRSAGGRDRILCLQEREPSPGADGGAPHPTDRSCPGATVARLAIPCLRHQHRTLPHKGRHLPPGPCPRGVGHTGPQSPCRALALPFWELLRQRRLAGLRHPGSQPVPVGGTPHPPGRTTNQRQHCPHPLVHTARKDRESRTKTDPAPSHPMALGRHLPHRSRRYPQPAATLLTRPTPQQTNHRKTSPIGSARPSTLRTPPDAPNKPAEPPRNLTHPQKTTPRRSPQLRNAHITTTRTPNRWIQAKHLTHGAFQVFAHQRRWPRVGRLEREGFT